MGRLTAISPVPWLDLLEFAGARGTLRKLFTAMGSRGQTAGFVDEAGLVAVVFLVPIDGHLEFCLSIRPRARVHMRELVGLAHLTLPAIADTAGAIQAHVMPGNRSGARMARLVGFVQDDADPTLWRFSR